MLRLCSLVSVRLQHIVGVPVGFLFPSEASYDVHEGVFVRDSVVAIRVL